MRSMPVFYLPFSIVHGTRTPDCCLPGELYISPLQFAVSYLFFRQATSILLFSSLSLSLLFVSL